MKIINSHESHNYSSISGYILKFAWSSLFGDSLVVLVIGFVEILFFPKPTDAEFNLLSVLSDYDYFTHTTIHFYGLYITLDTPLHVGVNILYALSLLQMF